MAKRSVLGRSVGFYSELDEKEDEVGCLEVGERDMEEVVFVVERVMERRRRKVSKYYILIIIIIIKWS